MCQFEVSAVLLVNAVTDRELSPNKNSPSSTYGVGGTNHLERFKKKTASNDETGEIVEYFRWKIYVHETILSYFVHTKNLAVSIWVNETSIYTASDV